MAADEKPKPQKEKQANAYLKYSGLAFQMIAAMLLGLWGGMKLDEKLGLQYPVFTVILLLLAVFASLYLLIVTVTRQK